MHWGSGGLGYLHRLLLLCFVDVNVLNEHYLDEDSAHVVQEDSQMFSDFYNKIAEKEKNFSRDVGTILTGSS